MSDDASWVEVSAGGSDSASYVDVAEELSAAGGGSVAAEAPAAADADVASAGAAAEAAAEAAAGPVAYETVTVRTYRGSTSNGGSKGMTVATSSGGQVETTPFRHAGVVAHRGSSVAGVHQGGSVVCRGGAHVDTTAPPDPRTFGGIRVGAGSTVDTTNTKASRQPVSAP